jgi:hypothetical protein
LLRRALKPRIGSVALGTSLWIRMFGAALAGAAVGWGIRMLLPAWHPIIIGVLVLTGFGVTYYALATLMGLSEARVVTDRLFRRLRPRR